MLHRTCFRCVHLRKKEYGVEKHSMDLWVDPFGVLVWRGRGCEVGSIGSDDCYQKQTSPFLVVDQQELNRRVIEWRIKKGIRLWE